MEWTVEMADLVAWVSQDNLEKKDHLAQRALLVVTARLVLVGHLEKRVRLVKEENMGKQEEKEESDHMGLLVSLAKLVPEEPMGLKVFQAKLDLKVALGRREQQERQGLPEIQAGMEERVQEG